MSARSSPASSTRMAGSRPPTAVSKSRKSTEHNALVRVSRLPGGIRLLVGRDLEERERMFHIVAVAGPVVGRARGGARGPRRHLREPPRAQPRRGDDGDRADHHGRRSLGPALGHRERRRVRPPGAQPQRHARAHRIAHAWAQGGHRQRRPRSQDAADAAAQPLRGGAAHRQDRRRLPRTRWRRRSRNPRG